MLKKVKFTQLELLFASYKIVIFLLICNFSEISNKQEFYLHFSNIAYPYLYTTNAFIPTRLRLHNQQLCIALDILVFKNCNVCLK